MPRRRHAWVRLPGRSGPQAALVLTWVRDADGWSAWVVVAEEDGRVELLQVGAAQLRPA
ncbi:hypothetical protein [Ornithinimicrobium avium]|uniref:hypothetical protein n=1 Tax=Ornithinimicrobium avium TaxID=2283195 RepID=UPI0013B42DB3|nr:hypothetical protein [Ornithinimicrobium avium]